MLLKSFRPLAFHMRGGHCRCYRPEQKIDQQESGSRMGYQCIGQLLWSSMLLHWAIRQKSGPGSLVFSLSHWLVRGRKPDLLLKRPSLCGWMLRGPFLCRCSMMFLVIWQLRSSQIFTEIPNMGGTRKCSCHRLGKNYCSSQTWKPWWNYGNHWCTMLFVSLSP